MFASKFRAGLYHRKCVPFEWNLYDAFCQFGFSGGESRRNYTYLVKEAIEAIGYTVEACSWGFHNSNCIKRITRISDGKGVYGEYCVDDSYDEWPDCAEYPEYKSLQDSCDDETCPHHRWLGGFLNGRTFVNTLPDDICETLRELQAVAKQVPGFTPFAGPSLVC
jgi:hypothetical protein